MQTDWDIPGAAEWSGAAVGSTYSERRGEVDHGGRAARGRDSGSTLREVGAPRGFPAEGRHNHSGHD